MRTLHELTGEFGDVAVVAVDTDPNEGLEEVRSYRDSHGYTFPMAVTHSDTIRSYKVTSQSTKVAIDRNGVVQVRSGYGTRGKGWWQDLFTQLNQDSS